MVTSKVWPRRTCVKISTRGFEHGSARTEVSRIYPLESGRVLLSLLTSAFARSAIATISKELCRLPRRGCTRLGESARPGHESTGSRANARATERVPRAGQYRRRHAFLRRSFGRRPGGARQVPAPSQ